MHTGSCLCGGIRFEIDGELAPIQICHCGQCRKAQGAALATNIPVSTDCFRLVAGQELLQDYESSPGKHRLFCSRCGSPILSRRDALPNVVRVRAGTIDVPLNTSLGAHCWVEARADWWPLDDELPRFAQAYVPPDR